MDVVIGQWQDVSFPRFIAELDRQGAEILDNQETTLAERKKLTELTKEFRKLPDEEKLKEFKSLLKSYQVEIDNLTKRTKLAENSFLNAYKTLASVSDPFPLLQQLPACKKELTDLKVEHEKVLGNLALPVGSIEDALLKKEEELNSLFIQKEVLYKERETSIQKQLAQQNEYIATVQKSYQDLQQKHGLEIMKLNEDNAKKIKEIDSLVLELENNELKIIQLERDFANHRRNQSVTSTYDDIFYVANEDSPIPKMNDTPQKETLRLLDQIESLSATIQQKEEALSLAREDMNVMTLKFQAREFELQAQLKDIKGYDRAMNELRILKMIEFDDDDQENEFSLERQLMEKNKRLSNQLTTLKNEAEILDKKWNSAVKQLEEATELSKTQKELLIKLEEDLRNTNTRLAMSENSEPQQSDDASVVSILTNQRDRYRQRNIDLEEAHRQTIIQITSLKVEIESLKKDNMNLYEKVRYTTSYTPSQSTIEIPGQYQQMYNEHIDPFRKFHVQEETRTYNKLNTAEKVALLFTKMIAGNKISRIIFVVYSGLLHILVMVTLYELAITQDCVTGIS